MNLENLGRQLQSSGKADKIKQIAQSDEGQRLSQMVDVKAIEAAAKSGDNQALRSLLGQILSTEEGRRLAENVKKIMED